MTRLEEDLPTECVKEQASAVEVDWHRFLADASPDRLAIIDSSYTFRAVNRQYLEAIRERRGEAATDWTETYFIGNSMAEILGVEFFETNVRARVDRALDGQRVSAQGWFDVPGLSQRFLSSNYCPFHRPGSDDVIGVVVAVRDLTDRQQQQKAILRLATHPEVIKGNVEASAPLFTETLGVMLGLERTSLWLLDETGLELNCQDRFHRPTEVHDRGEILAVAEYPGYFAALAEGRALDSPRDRPARTAEVSEYTYLDVPIRVSGEVAGVLCHELAGEQRLWQAEEVGFCGEVADLFAQVLLHREQRLLEDRLQQAQKMESLGVMAGGIAHDFNNLLVGILGNAELALEEELPGAARQGIEIIQRSARRAGDLCSQMLAYAGKGPLRVERLDLSRLVAETADLLASSIRETTRLELDLADDLPRIEVDPTQIRQVVMNLITNGSESFAGEKGVVRLSTSIERRRRGEYDEALSAGVLTAGTYVSLVVEDAGDGMDEQTVARIFEPFFTTKFTGRGLGMAAVLGIVRRHRGGIRVRSEVGQGTRIEVLIPARDHRPYEDEVAKLELPQPHFEKAACVLVVEDDSSVMEVVTRILEKAGLSVLAAETGGRGIECFDRYGSELDLVLLDITLPDIEGDLVLAHIRKHDESLPVLVASGYSAEDLTQRFQELRIAGFIHKPFRLKELLAKVHEVLAAHQQS